MGLCGVYEHRKCTGAHGGQTVLDSPSPGVIGSGEHPNVGAGVLYKSSKYS